MRTFSIACLAAVALISGGVFALRRQARAPLTPATIAARVAAAGRLVNDGVDRTIDRPAIVAAVMPPATMTPAARTGVTLLPTTDPVAPAIAGVITLTPTTATQPVATATTR